MPIKLDWSCAVYLLYDNCVHYRKQSLKLNLNEETERQTKRKTILLFYIDRRPTRSDILLKCIIFFFL